MRLKLVHMIHGRIIRYMRDVLTLVGIFLIIAGCEDFVSTNSPKTEITTKTLFSNDLSAVSAVRGMYSQLITEGWASGGVGSISILAGCSSDEFVGHYVGLEEFYFNSIAVSNSSIQNDLWGALYKSIYCANSIIEGLNGVNGVSDLTKKQLIGEAKFVRALANFYLVNLFGKIPLITTTDYRLTSIAKKVEVSSVYDLIINDLVDASNLLADDYSWSGEERVRVNRWAAKALLSRVYLFTKDWANAELVSSEVINNTGLYQLVGLDEVFLANSRESIWQLKPVVDGSNTNEAVYFIPGSTSSVSVFISLSDQLLNSFESADGRQLLWVSDSTIDDVRYYYPYKYKISASGLPLREYSTVLRLAEQYLIRAEARAEQDELAEALLDLNVIRTRAGLSNFEDISISTEKADIIFAVERERRLEFFSEWGHRWLDLKRWNTADKTLDLIKSDWQSSDVLYPIPQSEIDNDPNLKPQNPGY